MWENNKVGFSASLCGFNTGSVSCREDCQTL